MEDDLLAARQLSRRTNDSVDELRGLWQDEAARAVDHRWLAPFRSDDELALRSVGSQFAALTAVGELLVAGAHHLAIAEDRATQIADRLRRVATSLADCADALGRCDRSLGSSHGNVDANDARIREATAILQRAEGPPG